MNPNNPPSSDQNSQVPNTQFPYYFSNSYLPNPNSQVPNIQFSSPQNFNSHVQSPDSQFLFLNPFFSSTQNPQYQFPFAPNFQTPVDNQNSPNSQFSAFGVTNTIDLNDDCHEVEDIREAMGQ